VKTKRFPSKYLIGGLFIGALYGTAGCMRCCDMYFWGDMNIRYYDSSGESLFNIQANGANGYWYDSLAAYDFSNGKKRIFRDMDRGVVVQNYDPQVFTIRANYNLTNRYSTTIIHLKRGMEDTLIRHISESSYTETAYYDSIWYNGAPRRFESDGTLTIIR